jgi:hypothetical protein
MSCDVDTPVPSVLANGEKNWQKRYICLLDATPTNHSSSSSSSSSRELLIYMSIHPRIHVSHPIKKRRRRGKGQLRKREEKNGGKRIASSCLSSSPVNVAVVSRNRLPLGRRQMISLPWKTMMHGRWSLLL